ncbi:hypothetical protein BST61_g1114 [Cercospora zeina]
MEGNDLTLLSEQQIRLANVLIEDEDFMSYDFTSDASSAVVSHYHHMGASQQDAGPSHPALSPSSRDCACTRAPSPSTYATAQGKRRRHEYEEEDDDQAAANKCARSEHAAALVHQQDYPLSGTLPGAHSGAHIGRAISSIEQQMSLATARPRAATMIPGCSESLPSSFSQQPVSTTTPTASPFASLPASPTAGTPSQTQYAKDPASVASPKYRKSRAVVDLPEYVRPAQNVTITAEEISIFCPRWLAVPKVAVRFQRNGITNKMLVHTQLKASGLFDDESEMQMASNRVKQNFAQGGRLVFNCAHWKKQTALDAGKYNDLTANNWQTRDDHAAANGTRLDGRAPGLFANVPVSEFPTGRGRGIMTVCLEFVRNSSEEVKRHATTAHWAWLIQQITQAGLSVHPKAVDPSQNLEEDFVERFNASD